MKKKGKVLIKYTMRKFKRNILSFLMITIGAIIAAFSLERFLVPNTILDGGVTGISIIINNLSNIPLSMLIIIINIPFLIIGYKNLGKAFLIKGGYGMFIYSFMIDFFKRYKPITEEPLLAVVFGGVFLGIGVGLVLKNGGCMDGTESLSILINKKTNISVGQIIFLINILIYSVAGILFGWDRTMYSLLTYFISYKIIDTIEDGFKNTKAVMIITDNCNEIIENIQKKIGRTCTVIKGEGAISGDKNILYCVVTRVEINEIKNIIEDIDESAFITVTDVAEVIGNFKKRGDR